MTKNITAHIRMEERYEGLSLKFGDNEELKNRILDVIEEVKRDTGLKPMIFENISKEHNNDAIYLEFNDDVQRDAGDFFERVLCKLNIKCEKDDLI